MAEKPEPKSLRWEEIFYGHFFYKPGEESNWEGEEDTPGQERDFQQGDSEKKLIFQKNQIVLFPKRNLLPTEDKEDA